MRHTRRFPPSASRFIRSARVAHLATVDAAGQPHVVPICFVFDGRHIYSPLDEKPKKRAPLALKRVRNITANPSVAVIVDRYDEDWTRLGYVLVSGKARLLGRGARHRKAITLLRRKYPQYRNMALDKRPVIVIAPTHVVDWGSLTTNARP